MSERGVVRESERVRQAKLAAARKLQCDSIRLANGNARILSRICSLAHSLAREAENYNNNNNNNDHHHQLGNGNNNGNGDYNIGETRERLAAAADESCLAQRTSCSGIARTRDRVRLSRARARATVIDI